MIVDVLNRPFLIEVNIAELSGSVGIAIAPRDGSDKDTIIQNADVALYAAKENGKSGYRLFEPHLGKAMQERRSMEKELRQAVMQEDFQVVYQPVIDSATGSHIGAEALLRWNSPSAGNVPPNTFIPMAEELGLISRIGSFVLTQACAEAMSWPADKLIAVNVSTVQLLDPRLPQIVIRALRETGLEPHRLELEITETALLSNDELALQTLNKLRDIGVSISLDDFGTGYSSLTYLHRFPITRIKIDKSFVQRLPEDADSMSIIRAITQLAESLHLDVTAEGIETNEQFDYIANNGGGHLQGFLISKPIRSDQIREFFTTGKVRSAA